MVDAVSSALGSPLATVEPGSNPPEDACGGRVGAPRRRWRISPLGVLSLAAVALVLFCFTVPRLHGFMLHANEVDALVTARRLARALVAGAGVRRGGAGQGETGTRVEDVFRDARLGRELSDAEFLAGGRVLRRHGYLFRIATPFREADGARGIVLAWPWRHGLTGARALAVEAGGRALMHAGFWSGLERPPPVPPGPVSQAVPGARGDPSSAGAWRELHPGP